jgi:hypothetical protein
MQCRKYRATIVELRKLCAKLLAERRAVRYSRSARVYSRSARVYSRNKRAQEEKAKPSDRKDALTLICTNKNDDGSYFFNQVRPLRSCAAVAPMVAPLVSLLQRHAV